MNAPQKLSSLLCSQSASSLLSLPVAPRDNTPFPAMQKDITSSTEVSINEQLPAQREAFVPLSKEEPKPQESDLGNISAAASTILADGAMERRNFDHQENPHEESGITPANYNIQSDSRSPGDDQVEDSDESGEDSAPEEPLNNFVDEVSILKRLGLRREFYTEKEVESAFIHLSLAFKSDVFTLTQRLQVEEHARDVAEENIQKELEECKEILQKLGAVCTDGRRQKILKQLEQYLHILETSVSRVASHSEVLGALHQEARVSRGMQVMIQHVENLKCLHAKEHTELQAMKRIVQQNSRNRQFGEMRDDADFRNKHQMMRAIHQSTARRRVSIAVIPKQLMTFHCPDSKMADREEHRIDYNSTQLSGEHGQPFDSKLQNPHEDLPENNILHTVSDLINQKPLSESSEKEDESTFVNGSQKRSLEEIANCKSMRSGEASTSLMDPVECFLNRCNQEDNAGIAKEDEELNCDLNERESEENGDEFIPDKTSEGSLTVECLPSSTGMWSSLSSFQKMLTFAAFTLTIAWLLQLFSSRI